MHLPEPRLILFDGEGMAFRQQLEKNR